MAKEGGRTVKIAFICTHNACRSQMAEALAREILPAWAEPCSAGTDPAPVIDPGAAAELARRGISAKGLHPKPLSAIGKADIAVTMGCGVSCPALPCTHREDWELEDPMGGAPEGYEECADRIAEHLRELSRRLCQQRAAADARMLAVFKALADENRLAIVQAIADEGEICACELLEQLDITQATLSHHMKVLCQTGLVSCRREGRWCHYSIDPAEAGMLASFFGELRCTAEAPRCVASCC
ncbi:MAG: ArsR family transcriptional regulator [Coriobacteriaceae bacterium]|jgi:protein-tyrosine-phosphatase/DNA-binding transcriptional ArsR family regulator|nr:metalloregulator ArsR/SmtB family transcription factor [Atopobium sp.]MCH4082003.1 metalloregulator ArsR/SmtB family transcription factor [Atopobiaceae bacterium]RRF93179.1 MAG: ArsR family transcriptional regulator [Coriobacteriaceae bacterium]MCI1344842.1 metalloregulator ArsR/SmtB family transcription factor [Atopobiaceae bacterium]MCI1498909.1 metalloregulator ArsR/SmtB family transcription factor [Atopobiaceae bacterium]